jgi:hypothetical protein
VEYQLEGIRYGGSADRARVVIDLKPAPVGAPAFPPSTVEQFETAVIIRLDRTVWAAPEPPTPLVPNGAIIRSISAQPGREAQVLIRVELAEPLVQVQGNSVNNPPRLSFDFFRR